ENLARRRRSDDGAVPPPLRDAAVAFLRAGRLRHRRRRPRRRRLGVRDQADLGRAGVPRAWSAAAPERRARSDRRRPARPRPAGRVADPHLHGRRTGADVPARRRGAAAARAVERPPTGCAPGSPGSRAMTRSRSRALVAALAVTLAGQAGIRADREPVAPATAMAAAPGT